jgi:hypothetical protein
MEVDALVRGGHVHPDDDERPLEGLTQLLLALGGHGTGVKERDATDDRTQNCTHDSPPRKATHDERNSSVAQAPPG